ncbi:hypothetical protein C8R46DRAFT_1034727 [Mycena filopes]|nr:hypothetical protein C8R46DRAFT_1034727 [Mycena filopes]
MANVSSSNQAKNKTFDDKHCRHRDPDAPRSCVENFLPMVSCGVDFTLFLVAEPFANQYTGMDADDTRGGAFFNTTKDSAHPPRSQFLNGISTGKYQGPQRRGNLPWKSNSSLNSQLPPAALAANRYIPSPVSKRMDWFHRAPHPQGSVHRRHASHWIGNFMSAAGVGDPYRDGVIGVAQPLIRYGLREKSSFTRLRLTSFERERRAIGW